MLVEVFDVAPGFWSTEIQQSWDEIHPLQAVHVRKELRCTGRVVPDVETQWVPFAERATQPRARPLRLDLLRGRPGPASVLIFIVISLIAKPIPPGSSEVILLVRPLAVATRPHTTNT